VPELPDVEVYRRRIARNCLHRRIAAVEVHDAGVVRGISERSMADRLRARRLDGTRP
jgi:formamidopyrimidine-DNA glycosylase